MLRPKIARQALPTIAHDKAHGCTGILVYCRGLYCSQSSKISFETLKLADDVPIIHISHFRRFVCSKCGSRDVEVRADWPDPMERRRRRALGSTQNVERAPPPAEADDGAV